MRDEKMIDECPGCGRRFEKPEDISYFEVGTVEFEVKPQEDGSFFYTPKDVTPDDGFYWTCSKCGRKLPFKDHEEAEAWMRGLIGETKE